MVHGSQSSIRPPWRSLVPLVPLLLLVALAGTRSVDTLGFSVTSKHLGTITGLTAAAAAAHLCMQRPTTAGPILLGVLLLGTLFIAMGCATRLFSLASPDATSLSFGWFLQTSELLTWANQRLAVLATRNWRLEIIVSL